VPPGERVEGDPRAAGPFRRLQAAPSATVIAPLAKRCCNWSGTGSTEGISPVSVNILGDFNLAGEVWIIRDYFEKMGVEVVATITGDGRVDDIRRAHGAALNLVQCSGSMMHLAKQLQEKRGIPFKRVSYFGIEDMAQALYDTAGSSPISPGIVGRTAALVSQELSCRRLRNIAASWRGARQQCTWAARSKPSRWCARCAS
jgi:nitrogenase molybdenum-iron protein alpha/beta subunit